MVYALVSWMDSQRVASTAESRAVLKAGLMDRWMVAMRVALMVVKRVAS